MSLKGWIMVVSLMGSLFGSGLALARSEQVHILFTSFDPFGGRPTNNTQPIVELLRRNPDFIGERIDVQTCNLPVIYDQAAAVAMECIERVHPDMVVSLGEGRCGQIRIETAATNLNTSSSLDNQGQSRKGLPVISGAPRRLGFAFPVQEMFCALNAFSPSVKVSVSAGGYICNNTAYRLSQALRSRGIPFAFIHVPRVACMDERKHPQALVSSQPPVNAKVIGQMVGAAIRSLLQPADPGSPWPHPSNDIRMPATRGDAALLLELLKTRKAKSCELHFAEELLSAYGP